MKRGEHATGFALGYLALGLLLILMKDSAWEVILALGLLAIALIEFMGGEDRERNYIFMVLFAILGIAILFQSEYQYWILLFTFIVWGAYEIIEERNINPDRWDWVGVGALLVGAILLLTGLMGNTYESHLALAFGILMAIQGLKEWFS